MVVYNNTAESDVYGRGATFEKGIEIRRRLVIRGVTEEEAADV